MRTKGSAKFDPYFKVQYLDPKMVAWVDIQKAYPTLSQAKEAFLADQTCRVMQVTELGRSPITE
jgi:hypothetical protein